MKRVVAVVLGLGLLAAAPALAQKPPTAQQRRAAKAHFQQGKAYYEAGAWDDAAREYEQAYELVALPELLFNIGQAYRLKGDKPKAIAAYQRYLDKLPEGPLAEEARNHVAALKLKIQIEQAEAAKRKAEEEAAAAQRRAAEEAAARRRLEAEAAARARARVSDEERLKQIALEEAERLRRKKEADEREHQRLLGEARTQGHGLRIAGVWTMVGGGVVIVSTLVPVALAVSANERIKSFNDDRHEPWSESLDQSLRDRNWWRTAAVVWAGIGTGILVAGIVLHRVGIARRTRAVESVPRLTGVAPLVGPGSASLALTGRF
jgi:tetratricopeptide (TPR) repeat protein